MHHPNLKSDFPVSPTLGGQAGFLMDFINMPSPPQSEAAEAAVFEESHITSGDALAVLEPGIKAAAASPTPVTQPEGMSGIQPPVKPAQGLVLAERASIFGSSVVRGRSSVESLRRRLAQPPTLDCLPEDGTHTNSLEIEIIEMSGDNGKGKYWPTKMAIPELFRIIEVMDKEEIRDIATRLNDGCGQMEEPTAEISNVEKIKTVVRKRGFEITGFIRNEKDNKIQLSLLKRESFGVLKSIPSSPPHLSALNGDDLPSSQLPLSGAPGTTTIPGKGLFGPRIRNSVTMSNLRAAARDNNVSTPLYPSLKRTLRASASNGTLLEARTTTRAVQPSPIVSKTSKGLSPRKDTKPMMRRTPAPNVGSPSRNNHNNKLTKENLLLQEQLGALDINEYSEDIDNQRTEALDRTLKVGRDLLRKVDKDNAEFRAHLAGRFPAAGIAEPKETKKNKNPDRGTPQPMEEDVTEYLEKGVPEGFFRASSVAISNSQALSTSAGDGSRAGPTSRSKLLTSYERDFRAPLERSHRVYPPSDPRSLYSSPKSQDSVGRPNLRPASSMANIRAESREAARRPPSNSSTQPSLTRYRSFPTLHAATNLVASKEGGVCTTTEPARKNSVLSRPSTSQSNKQKQPPILAKKPAGSFGREIKWA